jgi:hypothetical protein
MKYMTPDLLTRSRSLDEDVAEDARTRWEEGGVQYKAHLKAIWASLPKSVRHLWRRFNLHDAKILTMALDQAPHFSIILQLDNPRSPLDQLIELKYRLVGGVASGFTLRRHPALAGDGKPLQWWLYDEIDVQSQNQISLFVHSILLTGGYELELRFFDLGIRRLRRFFSPSLDLPEEVGGERGLLALAE